MPNIAKQSLLYALIKWRIDFHSVKRSLVQVGGCTHFNQTSIPLQKFNAQWCPKTKPKVEPSSAVSHMPCSCSSHTCKALCTTPHHHTGYWLSKQGGPCVCNPRHYTHCATLFSANLISQSKSTLDPQVMFCVKQYGQDWWNQWNRKKQNDPKIPISLAHWLSALAQRSRGSLLGDVLRSSWQSV